MENTHADLDEQINLPPLEPPADPWAPCAPFKDLNLSRPRTMVVVGWHETPRRHPAWSGGSFLSLELEPLISGNALPPSGHDRSRVVELATCLAVERRPAPEIGGTVTAYERRTRSGRAVVVASPVSPCP